MIGGKLPEEIKNEHVDEVNRQINSNNVLMQKWDECKWRSDNEKTIIKSCCGRNEEVMCYNCHKLSINQLTPIICSRCNNFDKKENKTDIIDNE